jgi:endonuclease YncB( thermonuclease family)
MDAVDGTYTMESSRKFDLHGMQLWGRLVDVHDGDTVTVIVKLFDAMFTLNVRLLGINAPEMSVIDDGEAARLKLLKVLTMTTSPIIMGKLKNPKLATRKEMMTYLSEKVHVVRLDCKKNDKYGRVLANVSNANGVDAATTMLIDGFAVEYLV